MHAALSEEVKVQGEAKGEDALSNTENMEAQPIDWYPAGNNTTMKPPCCMI